MNRLLNVSNLCKSFGKNKILKDVSFVVDEGDILAFIGPNGSGKTTTIKLILGLQSIDKGTVTIDGYDIEKDFVNAIKSVGAIVESPDSYMYLSGYDNLKLIANNYKDITDDDIKRVVEYVGLSDRIHDKVSKYSLGMRQRLGIAKALLNNPKLLILDEPTNGLDPEGIKDLRDLLKNLASSGMGILISSHNLAELESFCNKVLIIDKGKIISESNVLDFKKSNRYLFNVSTTKGLNNKDIEVTSNNTFFYNGERDNVAKLVKELVKEDIDIYEIRECKKTLEEAFLNVTGGNND